MRARLVPASSGSAVRPPLPAAPSRRPFPRRALPIALALAGLLSPGPAAAQDGAPPDEPPTPTETPAPVEVVAFADLSLADAVSRAENEKRLLLVFWTSESFTDSARMRATTFQDVQLAEWVDRNAIAVEVDGPKDTAAAAAYKVTAYPCVDLYDPLLGLGVERLVGYSTADDLLASFSGALVGGGPAPKPDGSASEDPYAWLAYANSAWRNPATAEEAARAYGWVLRNGETYRPGFRARYFEFLLRRLAYLKPATMEAFRTLDAERLAVEGRLYTGQVDERTVYELVRLDWWMRREERSRETFKGLAGRGESADLARQLLYRHVLNDLGRRQEFTDVLGGLGAETPVGYLRRRLAELEADVTAQAAGKALKVEELDDRGEVVLAASWIYEALLAAGRGADAEQVVDLVAESLTSGRAFSLLVERAMRQGLPDVAVRVGSRGLTLVAGTQGERQLRRALAKVPGYRPPSDAPAEGGGQ